MCKNKLFVYQWFIMAGWMFISIVVPVSLSGQNNIAVGGYGDMLYPYVHEYDQILTYKIGVDYCPESEISPIDAGEVRNIIRKVNNLTRGIPKIVYLVGWQYRGHDTGYPSFLEVNPVLKREQDSSALASLRWLMRTASGFNTLVSLHVNFSDCYLDDNPLGKVYQERDILVRETDGRYREGYKWCDHLAYRASNYRNWYQGTFRTEQIEPLFRMIPELSICGSLHPDAWYNTENPYYQVDAVEDCRAMREMTVWMRKQYNVDLTTEFDLGRPEGVDFAMYHPLIWHMGWNKERPVDPMKIPSYFMTGGDAFFWGSNEISSYGKYFGHSSTLEGEINHDSDKVAGGLKSFATRTVPWYYLNRHLRSSFNGDTAFYSDGVTVFYKDKRVIIRRENDIIQDGNDVFIPALWKSGREIIAYSEEGYSNHDWRLPKEWSEVKMVDLYEISIEGLHPNKTGIEVSANRILKLTLEPDQGICIVPAGKDPDQKVAAKPSGYVRFLGTDTQTGGEWRGKYGKEGYIIIGDKESLSDNVDIEFINGKNVVWAKETQDVQALQKVSDNGRIAAALLHGLHEIVSVGFNDNLEHRISLYLLDWTRSGRWTVIDVIDSDSRKLLHSFNLTRYTDGKYLSYMVKGRISFRITNVWTQRYMDSPGAVISAVFVDDNDSN